MTADIKGNGREAHGPQIFTTAQRQFTCRPSDNLVGIGTRRRGKDKEKRKREIRNVKKLRERPREYAEKGMGNTSDFVPGLGH